MGPVSSSPLRVTVIDNQPRLAIIHPRRSINHFQRKQRGERSFKWGRFFYHDNCNYVQQISPRVPWCLHSLKWKRLPFPWLTAGILQIFLCFYFHCRGCERARRMTAHSNMAVGFCLDLKCVICKRFSAFVVACIAFQIYYGANQNVRIGVTLAASHRKFPLSLFSREHFNLLSLILQYIKDQQRRSI